jgi:hypothetical protein
MLVEAELIENAIQAGIDSFGHNAIVKQNSPQFAVCEVCECWRQGDHD